jgi:hypothetical protein
MYINTQSRWGNLLKKWALGSVRRIWEDNIKVDFRHIGDGRR